MFELKGKHTNATIYANIVKPLAVSQIQGLCNHPAFEGADIRIMPDVHAGDGCTIGTTAVLKEKKIIPNTIGADINCGIMTTIFKTNKPIDFKALDDFILENIPSGHDIRKEVHHNLKKEVEIAVSEIVKELNIGGLEMHLKSIGSLGSENHFIEVDKIDDETFALTVHTGSRNLGKKVCTYFQERAVENISSQDELRDAINELITKLKNKHREKEIENEILSLRKNFVCKKTGIPKNLAYIEGKDYDDYVRNMLKCGMMAHESRRLISSDILNYLNVEIVEQFDTIHNYIEALEDGTIVIRKGAISAKEGEKVSIPLNMKDGVIVGIGKGNKNWNCSAPHGAGRLLSRSKASEQLSLDDFSEQMKDVNTWSVCKETLDEAPGAYKPAESIIDLVKDTVNILYVMKPIYNFKAHVPHIS